MALVKSRILLRANIHSFQRNVFGSIPCLVNPPDYREKDTLIITCSELGVAPDCISFGAPERFLVLQHIAGSMPSKAECEVYEGLSCAGIEQLFEKCEFRHVIVCGHLDCGVIARWLQPAEAGERVTGDFRRRFETGTRTLVDNNYFPNSSLERLELMIFEHVLCQIENLLTHSFVAERVRTGTSFYGRVVDDESARVYGYDPDESAFSLI